MNNQKPKFTPGPWELSDCGEHVIGNCNADDILEVADLSNTLHAKEDARLIAAAPELLKAAQALLEVYIDGMLDVSAQRSLWTKLEKALNKAGGES